MLPCAFGVDHRSLIDEYLRTLAARTGAPKPLVEPLRKSLTSSGKRVRGILTLSAGEAAGCKAEKLVEAAAAMEMIHTCSLILDDLPSMDDAALRRGAPTLHREFGEDLAILSAVALLNHSYGLVAKNYAALNPRQWPMLQVIKRVVDAVGWDGTIAGEAAAQRSARRGEPVRASAVDPPRRRPPPARPPLELALRVDQNAERGACAGNRTAIDSGTLDKVAERPSMSVERRGPV